MAPGRKRSRPGSWRNAYDIMMAGAGPAGRMAERMVTQAARAAGTSVAGALFGNQATQTDKRAATAIGTFTGGTKHSHVFWQRTKKVAKQFDGRQTYHYTMSGKGSMTNDQTKQTFYDLVSIWNHADIETIIGGHPLTSDHGEDNRNNTRSWLLRSCTIRSLFTSVSSIPAHCILYTVRTREKASEFSTIGNTVGEGLDEITNAAGTLQDRWFTTPELSPRFRQEFEVLSRVPFDLQPGEEHINETHLVLNRHYKYINRGIGSTGDTFPGNTIYQFLLIFGGLVTEDGAPTEVAIGSTRVNVLFNQHYRFVCGDINDLEVGVWSADAQDTVDVPKRMTEEGAPAEIGEVEP